MEGVMLSDLRVPDVRNMGPFPERDFAGSAMHDLRAQAIPKEWWNMLREQQH